MMSGPETNAFISPVESVVSWTTAQLLSAVWMREVSVSLLALSLLSSGIQV